MAVIQKDLGPVTAYAAAVAAGYTGTKAEFETLMASYATVAENAAASAAAAAADARKAEGWAAGTQDGTDVGSDSEYYHKDATYLAEQANSASTAANTSALKAEGWAAGTQNGTAVPQNSPYYHNDAAYLAGQAANSATSASNSAGSAETNALKAEGFTEGTQNGTAVGNSSEYYQHNMKYYKEHIDSVKASIPLEYDELSADVVELQEAMESKAEVDGYYETMTVGDAEQLVSTMYAEDKGAYNFRTSGGSVDIGNREQEMIVGGTIGWNQLINKGQFKNTETVSGVTFTNNGDGSWTMAGTPNANNYYYLIAGAFAQQVEDHVYYYAINGLKSVTVLDGAGWWPNIGANAALNYVKGSKPANIAKSLANGNITLAINFNSTNATAINETFYVQLFDLTAMFGSTIADYIYGLEQANAGAGVAWFRKLFPKSYYAYNAGELMSVKALKHQMTGFNQWDEEWELGTFNTSNGSNVSSSTQIRAKNKIPCLPGMAYRFNCVGTLGWFMFFDKDDNVIPTPTVPGSSTSYQNCVSVNNRVFTTPENAASFRFYLLPEYGTTYKNDICINLSWSGYRNGEYEPYELHTVELDPDLELRGIPKLDEDGHLVYDGDTYESDGTVTRRFADIDLGSLTWNATQLSGSGNRFYSSSSEISSTVKLPANTNTAPNIWCSAYPTKLPYQFGEAVNGITIYTNGSVQIYDSSLSSDTAEQFKTAMSGVYLVYELAEPTEETADIYANPQWVNDFGTEEYVDAGIEAGTRDVAIPVGHETKYTANLRDKLQHLPDTAEEDGIYFVKQESKQMKLTKAEGTFENFTAGSAQQLISSQLNNDQEPYVFRTAGGSADIGNRKNESIVGGTICWNQLAVDGLQTPVTSTGQFSPMLRYGANSASFTTSVVEGHVYMLVFTQPAGCAVYTQSSLKIDDVAVYNVGYKNYAAPSVDTVIAKKAVCGVTTNSCNMAGIVSKTETTETGYALKNVQFFDLTQMFGSTIANYLNTLTHDECYAWFRKLFPKPYYAYNAGELMSVKAAAMETVGFNQWDGEWERYGFDTTTGQKSTNSNFVRSKNKIRVVPGASYYGFASSKFNGSAVRLFFYDEAETFISTALANTPVTAPANAYYATFHIIGSSIEEGDICINLSWSGYRNGEYEPYVKRTYPLDSSLELRGIPKLSADNTMYFDGDTYEPDGTVTRKYNSITVNGSETWSTSSSDSTAWFYCVPAIAPRSTGAGDMRIIASKVFMVTNGRWGTDDSIWAQYSQIHIRPNSTIAPSGNTSAGLAEFKTWLTSNPITIVYECATPTEESAEPFQSPQIVDDFGTERFIDAAVEAEERDVEIPVGHSTDYMANLRDKLQHLPDLGSGNGTYAIVQSNNQLSLTPLTTPTELPDAPTTDGTYTLKVTVASGTPTYSWVAST